MHCSTVEGIVSVLVSFFAAPVLKHSVVIVLIGCLEKVSDLEGMKNILRNEDPPGALNLNRIVIVDSDDVNSCPSKVPTDASLKEDRGVVKLDSVEERLASKVASPPRLDRVGEIIPTLVLLVTVNLGKVSILLEAVLEGDEEEGPVETQQTLLDFILCDDAEEYLALELPNLAGTVGRYLDLVVPSPLLHGPEALLPVAAAPQTLNELRGSALLANPGDPGLCKHSSAELIDDGSADFLELFCHHDVLLPEVEPVDDAASHGAIT